MSLVIRNILQSDNKRLAEIIRTTLIEFKANKPGTVFFDPTTDNLFDLFKTVDSPDSNRVYFVAEYNNQIIGGCGLFPTSNLPDGCTELVKLYLSPNGRGIGAARILMEKCFETAKELGYKQIYLESLPELKTAVGLYLKTGFVPLQKPLGNSGHFGCNIWMIKDLL